MRVAKNSEGGKRNIVREEVSLSTEVLVRKVRRATYAVLFGYEFCECTRGVFKKVATP